MSFLRELVGVFVSICILGAGIGGFLWLGQAPEVSRVETAEECPTVVAATVSEFSDNFELVTDGVAIPFRQVSIPAEVDGRVTEQVEKARAGRFVVEGDFLLEIDRSDYKLEVDRLQAMTDQATEELAALDVDISNTQTLIELAKKQLALHLRDQDRMEKLAVRSASSQAQLDDAQGKVLTAQNNVQSLVNQLSLFRQRRRTSEAGLRLAKLQGEKAQLDLNRTRITSPITGSIITSSVEESQYVREGDVLFTLSDASRMEVMCNLEIDQIFWVLEQGPDESEMDLETRFRVPQLPVRVLYDFEGQVFEWEGRLDRYEGTGVDQETRTIPCRIAVEQPTVMKSLTPGSPVKPPALVSGMYVKLRIPIKPQTNLLKVPAAALRPGGQVWKVENNVLTTITVNVARKEADFALIRPLESLSVGDRVVTSPLAAVSNNMKVQERPE